MKACRKKEGLRALHVRRTKRAKHDHPGRFLMVAGAALALEMLGAVAWRRWRAHRA